MKTASFAVHPTMGPSSQRPRDSGVSELKGMRKLLEVLDDILPSEAKANSLDDRALVLSTFFKRLRQDNERLSEENETLEQVLEDQQDLIDVLETQMKEMDAKLQQVPANDGAHRQSTSSLEAKFEFLATKQETNERYLDLLKRSKKLTDLLIARDNEIELLKLKLEETEDSRRMIDLEEDEGEGDSDDDEDGVEQDTDHVSIQLSCAENSEVEVIVRDPEYIDLTSVADVESTSSEQPETTEEKKPRKKLFSSPLDFRGSLKKKYIRVKEEKADLEVKLVESQRSTTTLQTQLKTAKKEIVAVVAELKRTQKLYEQMCHCHDADLKKIELLQADVNVRDDQLKKASETQSQLQDNRDLLVLELEDSRKQIYELHQSKGKAETDHESTKKVLEAQLEEAKEKFRLATVRLEDRSKMLKDVIGQYKSLNQEHHELSETYRKLKLDHKSSLRTVESLRLLQRTNPNSIPESESHDSLEEEETLLQELRNQLENAITEKEYTAKEADQLKLELGVMQRQVNAILLEKDLMNKSNMKLRQELAEMAVRDLSKHNKQKPHEDGSEECTDIEESEADSVKIPDSVEITSSNQDLQSLDKDQIIARLKQAEHALAVAQRDTTLAWKQVELKTADVRSAVQKHHVLEKQFSHTRADIESLHQDLEMAKKRTRMAEYQEKETRHRLSSLHSCYQDLRSQYEQVVNHHHQMEETMNALMMKDLVSSSEKNQVKQEMEGLSKENEELQAFCDEMLQIIESK